MEQVSVDLLPVTVLVWRYGARTGVEIPKEVEHQLRLAHELGENW
jgi:hypothetical protein